MRWEGTPHCPHCSMPLFANPFSPGETAFGQGGVWLEPHVLLVEDAFPKGAELVELSERLDAWVPMAVVGAGGATYGEQRSGDQVFVSAGVDAGLGPYERALTGAFHAAAGQYAAAVPNVVLQSDLGFQLLRYPAGGHFHEHVDVAPGSIAVPGQRQLSALLYLNDDYEGGELDFPRQGLRYNPKAGAMILFPSNFCFPHASLPVQRGTKYVVATWFV